MVEMGFVNSLRPQGAFLSSHLVPGVPFRYTPGYGIIASPKPREALEFKLPN